MTKIPADLFALQSMRTVMTARGDMTGDLYRCRCSRELPPEDFACTDGLPGDLPRFVCYTCASHAHRVALAEQAAEEAAQLAAWETEAGKACKAERDRRVNNTLWTTAAGSPLTEACQEQFTAWRAAMFRLSVDLPDPIPNDSSLWPSEPALEYQPVTS